MAGIKVPPMMGIATPATTALLEPNMRKTTMILMEWASTRLAAAALLAIAVALAARARRHARPVNSAREMVSPRPAGIARLGIIVKAGLILACLMDRARL